MFQGTEFVGTNVKGSNFKKACFKNAIFNSVVLDKADFDDALFEDTIFLSTGMKNVKHLPENTKGIIILDKMPHENGFSNNLLMEVEQLRFNDIIRRSSVLHLKNKRINTLSLFLLLKQFSEEELFKALPLLPENLTTQFYTVSYLQKLLIKIIASAKL